MPLLELPQAQFLLMSATLGDVTRFVDDLTRRTGRETAVVSSADAAGAARPTSARETPLHETHRGAARPRHQAPVYVVHFTQARRRSSSAQALTSINVCTREEKDRIAELIGGFRFSPGFGKTLSRLVKHGIGVHHAGHAAEVPPPRRAARAGRAAQGHLRHRHARRRHQRADPHRAVHRPVASTTDADSGMLKAREFHQIAGRAGRAGFDTAGTVVVQAPEHVVENHRLVQKAGDDPKKLKRVQRKKAPEG